MFFLEWIQWKRLGNEALSSFLFFKGKVRCPQEVSLIPTSARFLILLKTLSKAFISVSAYNNVSQSLLVEAEFLNYSPSYLHIALIKVLKTLGTLSPRATDNCLIQDIASVPGISAAVFTPHIV